MQMLAVDQSFNGHLQKKSNAYFWLFVIIHTLIWTIGPALTRATLPHDTLEGITWGLQWQLGYNKHPFLTAWLCAGVTQLFNTVGWPVYLLAQLAVSMTFFAVWQLAKHMLPPVHALISALVLEGILFYNINSFNFTPDTLQSPLWALLTLFLYKALNTQKITHWLYTGTLAALCLCTKYQAVLLLGSAFLFCIINTVARQSFQKKGMYLGLSVFLLLITPHIIWLYQHHFITLTYAETAASEYTQKQSLLHHFIYPLRFLINNFIDVIGLFLLLWPFYGHHKAPLDINHFNRQFLIYLGLGPLVFSLILCFLSGDYFPPRWATPYFFALGILAIIYLKPTLSKTALKQFAITLILFSSLLFIGRMLTFTLYPRPASDAFLPNKEIALSITQLWQAQYHRPLPYIAGSNYLVALTTPYLTDKPKPYLGVTPEESAWINEQDLREKGAVFLWDEGQNFTWDHNSKQHSQLQETLTSRFPELKIIPSHTFYRKSDNHPIIIGIAFLPPKERDPR